MGEEAKVKGAHVILGPTINMQRSPLNGRGFESFSEDPVLAGLIAAAVTKGIQKVGVAATPKHFVCNDQEHQRMAYDAIITERALREIYLMPFQIAIRDADPWALMTAYNKVNGIHNSEHPKIVKGILREEWGWNGIVMSDWYGTYSTSESIKAGLDLEMPGPTKWRGGLLEHALTSNKISKQDLDERARKVLELVNHCAKSGVPEDADVGQLPRSKVEGLLRRCASESIVLLKNERKVLPFKKDKPVLVIGPNAQVATYCGGGSASVRPYYTVTPFDGIQAKVESELQFALGSYSHKELPLLGPQVRTAPDSTSEPGVIFRAYNEPPEDAKREAVDEITITDTYMLLPDYECPRLRSPLWYATVDGYYTAARTGTYELGLCVSGTAQLFVDDKLVIDNASQQTQGETFFGNGTVEVKGTVEMEQGKTYHVRTTFASSPSSKLRNSGVTAFPNGGLRIGGAWVLDPQEEIHHATKLAGEAEQVVVCAGLNMDWEGEGADREHMRLPGRLDELISAVARARDGNVAVVLQSGTPVEMPWLDEVAALAQAWYGGNETGNGIADVLFGDANPSGKLPLSFPRRVQDNPAYLNYRCEGGRTLYGEDVYVGYRWYEALEREVAFAFGHGLSYTTFELSGLDVSVDGTELRVKLQLKNDGEVDGAETVQVYVAQKRPSIRRPPKELKGFAKRFLKKGESAAVEIAVPLKYAASFWDEGRDAWVMEKGEYAVLVGTSSVMGSGSLEGKFEVKETSWWKGL